MSFHTMYPAAPKTVPLTTALAALVVFMLLFAGSPARAVEVLSAEELASHCVLLRSDPDGADAQYCIRYIQGFIDGAIATDVNVMLNAETVSPDSETFSQRAKRTRAPSRAEQFRAAQLAGFCLGEPLPLRDVVDVVVADLHLLADSAGQGESAMEVVYASLQRHYPCES
tara:strand:- start:105296 stop:105805 length:510 start_codon:yes stop_codon:yes gene_type:complete